MERRDFLKSAAAVGASAVFPAAPLAAEQGKPKSPPQELYPLGPDSKPEPGVPAGVHISFKMDDSRIYPGTHRMIDVYVPAQYTAARPACVWVSLDGLLSTLPAVLDNLIHKKELPVMIAVGLHPGTTESADGTENPRFNRSFEFDSLTDVLARFILEEMLPAVEKQKTPAGLPILLSKNPDDRGITGASSGGIGAFTVAWQRPDAFRRVYTMIGTYVGMRGGDRYPVLVRKTEPKPLRIFLQDNDNDGWPGGLELGDWWMGNREMERALTFAGYEVNHAWQHGGHDSHQGESILPEVMRWLWKDWPAPVTAGKTSNFAVAAIAKPHENWAAAAGTPKLPPGVPINADFPIYASRPVIDENSTAACLASDRQGRVYVQNPSDGVIYRIAGGGRLESFAKAAPGDNGIAFGPDGRLHIAEVRSGNVLTYGADGKTEIVGVHLGGHRLTVAANGNIYATQQTASGGAYSGSVMLLRPGHTPISVAKGLNGPAGISLTPDGLWLCVAEAGGHHAYSYRVQPDGTLQDGEPFYWFHVPDSANDSGATQVCMDRQGWAYAATRMGVQVFDRNGRVTAILPVGGNQLAGICFGDADFQTLYVSTGTAVYRRRAKTIGMPNWEQPIVLPPWSAG